MNILVLNYEYPPIGGGAGPATRDLSQGFAERGHEVDVVTMGYGGLPRKEKVDENLTVHRVRCLRSSESFCSFWEMLSFLPFGFWRSRKLVKEKDYDINHTHFIFPTAVISYFLNYLYDTPYLITSHGADVPGFNPDRFTLVHKFLRPFWNRIVGRSEGILSPSEHLKSLIKESGYDSSIRVLPNPFDYSKFHGELGKNKTILLTGRLIKRKKFQNFLQSFETIDTDWKVIFTGEGSYRKKLEREADKIDNDIEFLGWVDREKLNQLLEKSQVYVFPTDHANCPVGLQEAMASGNAILASNKGGAKEMVGDAGLKVDIDNSREFKRKLEELLQDRSKRTKLARKARKRVKNNYSQQKIVQKYLKVFKQSISL